MGRQMLKADGTHKEEVWDTVEAPDIWAIVDSSRIQFFVDWAQAYLRKLVEHSKDIVHWNVSLFTSLPHA